MSKINGSPTRLWIKFLQVHRNPVTGCEEWQHARNSDGYGQIRIEGKSHGAHRVSYELQVGTIPIGLYVLHACDNPPCIRPEHLWLGTHQDNMRDAAQKGRAGGRRLTPPTSTNPPPADLASQTSAKSELPRKSGGQ